MNAFPTAKRPALLLTSLLLVMIAGNALATDDEHGYLGVTLQDVTDSMARALQLEAGPGVLIESVVDDSPAAASGLEDGDVILEFDGKTINDSGDLTKAVRATAPGDKIALAILHQGKRQTAHVEMGKTEGKRITYTISSNDDLPDAEFFGRGNGHRNIWISDDGDQREITVITDGDDHDCEWAIDGNDKTALRLARLSAGLDRGFMGVELDDLSEQLGEYFGVDDGEGALVSKVIEDSPAAAAGFMAGDVIIGMNDEEVENPADVYEFLNETESAQEISVKIVRKGKNKTLPITLGEVPEDVFARYMRRFEPDVDRDVRVIMPHGMHGRHPLHHLCDDERELSEVRAELEELRKDLQELKSEMNK